MKKLSVFALFAVAAPLFVSAQETTAFSYLDTVGNLVNQAIPFLITLGVIAFLWGLVKFIFGGASDVKEAGKGLMLGSIIALALMVGVWGVVKIVLDTFDIDPTSGDTLIDDSPKTPDFSFDQVKSN